MNEQAVIISLRLLVYPYHSAPPSLCSMPAWRLRDVLCEAPRDVCGESGVLDRQPAGFPMRSHRPVLRRWAESHLREPPSATENKSWISTCSCRGPDRSGRVESLAGRWFASLLSCWYPLQLLVLIGSGQRRCAGYRVDGIPWEQGFGLRTRSALRPAERGRSP